MVESAMPMHASSLVQSHLGAISAVLGLVQAHAMSTGRAIFLAVLVVFFCALFIGTYVFMRRPDFGQRGGRHSEVGDPKHPS